jgi:hypothetical protein
MAISAQNAAPILLRRRVLSSAFTLFMKYLFPTIWISGFGLAAVTIMLNHLQDQAQGRPENPHAPPPFVFFAIWLIGSAFLLFFCRSIKRVETDDTNLYVSNFFQEVKVPLSNVEAVTECRWINQRPVTIHFRTPTSLGKSVMFIPRQRMFGFFSTHPVVLELRRLAALQYQEPEPMVALGSTASMIPGSNWIARRLAAWDKANPKTFVTVNFVIGLLIALSNSIVLFTDGRGIPPTILAVARYVTLPISALLALSALIGLAQPDFRRGVLRLHGLLLLAAAILLVTWMAEISRDGLPPHTVFSWSPGLAELAVCYATFIFTRFTLRAEAQQNAVIFYLPAWVLLPVIALDVGVLVRFGGMVFTAFSGP